MAANTMPIWTGTAKASSVVISAANTRSDGNGTIGTDIFLAATIGSNAGFVEAIEFLPHATAAGTSTTATVGRVFWSTQGSGATTSSNTNLIREVVLPSVTAASTSAANPAIAIPIGRAFSADAKILVTMHAAPAANTAWVVTVYFGDY